MTDRLEFGGTPEELTGLGNSRRRRHFIDGSQQQQRLEQAPGTITQYLAEVGAPVVRATTAVNGNVKPWNPGPPLPEQLWPGDRRY